MWRETASQIDMRYETASILEVLGIRLFTTQSEAKHLSPSGSIKYKVVSIKTYGVKKILRHLHLRAKRRVFVLPPTRPRHPESKMMELHTIKGLLIRAIGGRCLHRPYKQS